MAEPSRSTQAEVRRIQDQIDKIDGDLSVVVEQYNSSALTLNKTRGELQSVNAKLQAAQKQMDSRQELINSRFDHIYRRGSLSYLEVLMSTQSLEQFLYYLELIERQSAKDAEAIVQFKQAQHEMIASQAVLKEKERKQQAIVAEVKAKKDKIAAQLKQRNTLLAKIKKDLARQRLAQAKDQAKLKRSLKQRIQRDEQVARATRVSVSRGSGRAGAVSLALQELGKPYSWGASGPSSYDCSGLTRHVYGKLGVSLPHSSRAQYSSGQRVSMDELQAGDLVFFARSGTISHVGIYVGGGNFIHAPRTGDVVKITSLSDHGGYVGAVRP